jgi:hypothetical protein
MTCEISTEGMSVKNKIKYYAKSGMDLVHVQYMMMLLARDCSFAVTVSSRKKNVLVPFQQQLHRTEIQVPLKNAY